MKLPGNIKSTLSIREIQKITKNITETKYVTIGGGIGSFVFVDYLRIVGIPHSQIAVITDSKKPYEQFRNYCENSGIGPNDRIRSDSSGRPDNIWGFPGFAVSEAIEELRWGNLFKSFSLFYQIFTEPILRDFYSPKSSLLFNSMDRESKRINWDSMKLPGKALFIRKTTDDRLVIFVEEGKKISAVIANFLHLSLGHKGKRSKLPQNKRISFIYEDHDDLINDLKNNGGKIVILGRGIAAARIIEKLLNFNKDNLEVISLFRDEESKDSDFRKIKRANFNGWKLQYFNWPRSAFGGSLSSKKQSFHIWSTPTTPPRREWISLLNKSLQNGLYKIEIGDIQKITETHLGLLIEISKENLLRELHAQYIIDCTGFDDSIFSNELYSDLQKTYRLPLTTVNGFEVNNSFEIEKLKSENSRVFITGTSASGNHYGPVDSFFGQGFASYKIVESIGLFKKFNFIDSIFAWGKWIMNFKI